MKNLVLIGMMGTFKTSAGEKIAQTLNLDFIDTDAYYVKTYNQAIQETFDSLGEQIFRAREGRVVKYISELESTIISCGGGVVLQEENMINLKKNGIVFSLFANAEQVKLRVGSGLSRPILRNKASIENILNVMETREPLYKKYGDYFINTDNKTSSQVAQEIIDIYEKIVGV